MTRAEFDFFLAFSAGLCVLMALFNLVRSKKRGTSAYLLSGAFVSVAAGLLLYRSGASQAGIAIFGIIAFCLMAADIAVRAKNLPPGGFTK